VVGVPDEVGSENVWAYVVPQPGANLTPQEVLDYCQGEIAPYKVPSEVRILDVLPMTPTTKARKFKLREMVLQELWPST
jgi:acyl-CoA synthetase (AMP-forming)/AMP-acid ligase II